MCTFCPSLDLTVLIRVNRGYLDSTLFIFYSIAMQGCSTTEGQPCIFPWHSEGILYYGCTLDGSSRYICPTAVDEEDYNYFYYDSEYRGDCKSDCPKDDGNSIFSSSPISFFRNKSNLKYLSKSYFSPSRWNPLSIIWKERK